MQNGGAHIVVAMHGRVAVRVLLESAIRRRRADSDDDVECVWLGNLVPGFEIGAAVNHREALPRAVGPRGLDLSGGRL